MTEDGSHNRNRFTPLLVAALLLSPLFYLGSYFAMVSPHVAERPNGAIAAKRYRFGEEWAKGVYWPLDEINRKLFPQRWEV